jgi:hypothetical protein
MPAIGHLAPCREPELKFPGLWGNLRRNAGGSGGSFGCREPAATYRVPGGGVMPSSQVSSAQPSSGDTFHLGKSRCNIQCAVRNPQGHPPSNPIGYLSSLHCSPNPAACLLRREAPEAQSAYRKSPRPAVKSVKRGLARANGYRALRRARAARRRVSTAHGLFRRPAVAFRHGSLHS